MEKKIVKTAKKETSGFYDIYVKDYNIKSLKKKDGTPSEQVEIRIFPSQYEVYSFRLPKKFVSKTKNVGTMQVGLVKTFEYDVSHSYKKEDAWQKPIVKKEPAIALVNIYNKILKQKKQTAVESAEDSPKKQAKRVISQK
ncbi:MAG: hypothetical protein LBT17_00915 [Mycoplasmataceae bacterium]|jgi:hypothetical protein|nr:hypothetical protein [Mycoplasmataceae bacterium]